MKRSARPTRGQLVSGIASLVAYAVGYPIAIVGGSGFGWVLVMLGGLLLLVFGALTVQRITRGS